MDFTSLYTSSSTLLSPNCELILTATPALLVLRDATSFQVLQSWRRTATTTTPQLGFSDDSRYCAVADVDAGTVNVYSVASEHVAAVIHAGSEALQGARWIPSSSGTRWIACWSKHGVGDVQPAGVTSRYSLARTILTSLCLSFSPLDPGHLVEPRER